VLVEKKSGPDWHDGEKKKPRSYDQGERRSESADKAQGFSSIDKKGSFQHWDPLKTTKRPSAGTNGKNKGDDGKNKTMPMAPFQEGRNPVAQG